MEVGDPGWLGRPVKWGNKPVHVISCAYQPVHMEVGDPGWWGRPVKWGNQPVHVISRAYQLGPVVGKLVSANGNPGLKF